MLPSIRRPGTLPKAFSTPDVSLKAHPSEVMLLSCSCVGKSMPAMARETDLFPVRGPTGQRVPWWFRDLSSHKLQWARVHRKTLLPEHFVQCTYFLILS